jgi:hypothetical protein
MTKNTQLYRPHNRGTKTSTFYTEEILSPPEPLDYEIGPDDFQDLNIPRKVISLWEEERI